MTTTDILTILAAILPVVTLLPALVLSPGQPATLAIPPRRPAARSTEPSLDLAA